MLSQKTYSVDPPQKIQLLQEPRLLTLQTLCHTVHFPEKDANTAVMRDCAGQGSYQGRRRRAEDGCPGALTGTAGSAPRWGQRVQRNMVVLGEHLPCASAPSRDLSQSSQTPYLEGKIIPIFQTQSKSFDNSPSSHRQSRVLI